MGNFLPLNHPGKADEVFDTEALGSQVEDRVGRKVSALRSGFGGFSDSGSRFHNLCLSSVPELVEGGELPKDRLEGIAQGLAPLAESGFDHCTEKLFVAVEGCP